jgi:hypothetical protein
MNGFEWIFFKFNLFVSEILFVKFYKVSICIIISLIE